MEYRNTSHQKLFGLNALACFAIVTVAVALVCMAYFNYQAKVKEAESVAEMSKGFIGIMKMGERTQAETQRAIEKMEQQQKEREALERQQQQTQTTPPTSPLPDPSPVQPASDPPAQLPAYNSPQTPSPYPTR